jgi:molecular chaperone DnaK
MKQFAYQILDGDDGEAAVCIGDHRISLEEISALILKEVRESASTAIGRVVNRAVITCPANYTERQRQAVRTAGELAGFHVERILNEPSAAALNYGLGRGLSRRRVMVYDLGGGSFSATLIEIEGDDFSVIASGGEPFLGGDDFDGALMQLLIEHIREHHQVDPSSDPMAVIRLQQAAERAKRELSEMMTSRVVLDGFFVDEWAAPSIQIELSRVVAEQLFVPLVERTLRICREVCARGQTTPSSVDDVILVGGQSRSPLVQRLVQAFFDKEPHRSAAPDHAVSFGAAQYAQRMGALSSLKLVDTLPASIGIGLPGGRFLKLIARDTRLPMRCTHHIETARDGQSSIDVTVFQGEEDEVMNNELIGTLKMKNLPLGPAGSVSVEVVFELTEECILRLSATEGRSGQVVASDLVTRGTPEEIRMGLGPVSQPESVIRDVRDIVDASTRADEDPSRPDLLESSDTTRMDALLANDTIKMSALFDPDGAVSVPGGIAGGEGAPRSLALEGAQQGHGSSSSSAGLDSSARPELGTGHQPGADPIPQIPLDETLELETASAGPAAGPGEASEGELEAEDRRKAGLLKWIKTKLGGTKRRSV